jgi:hypothetical protein
LSQADLLAITCDKEELCDSAMIIPVPQLVKETDSFVLERNACAENKKLLPIATEKDELKLLSFLNTLGYIEFDTLCALSNLKEKFVCAELPWLYRCTYHFIGKYNCKGDYMVHRFYICSNLNSPFTMRQYDQLEGCNSYNHVISRPPSFILKKQDKSQKKSTIGYYLLHILQLRPNRGRFAVKKERMKRTSHLRIWPLIIR